MKSYSTTPVRRKLRGPNQISNDYWLAFRSLYGCDRSAKTPAARTAKIDDLNAEKMQVVSL